MYAQRVILGILPYLTALIVVYGITRRIRRWRNAASSRSVLYTSAAANVKSGPKGKRFAADGLFFHGLFTGNRRLWFESLAFHAVLLLVLFGHTRVIVDFPGLWSWLGLSAADVDSLAALLGGLAGLLLLAAALCFLARRLLVARIREISGRGEWAVILLVCGVVLSGDLLRFNPAIDLAAIRAQLPGALLLRPGPALNDTCFLLHVFLAQILALFLPFGNLVHMYGIFFSRPLLDKKEGCGHDCRECC